VTIYVDVYEGGDSNPFNRNRKPVCNACYDIENAAFMEREAHKDLMALQKNGAIDIETATAPYCRFSGGTPVLEAPNADNWTQLRGLQTAADVLVQNYFFYGPSGTGKTSAARCLLNRAYAMGPVGIRETTGRAMCKEWALFEEKQKTAWAWKRARLLLIDDIDKADWGFMQSLPNLWDCINHRTSHGYKTIITSNLTPSQLIGDMTSKADNNTTVVDAIFDRLNPCLKLEFTGQSMRRAKS